MAYPLPTAINDATILNHGIMLFYFSSHNFIVFKIKDHNLIVSEQDPPYQRRFYTFETTI
jgi:predicted Rossmann fold nucleotide-binding protein DprA/Smf involved in DNA uptake